MRKLLLCLLLLLLASCAAYTRYQLDQQYGAADPARFGHPISTASAVSYRRDVKPITDSRCAVCHGCFDAPCQLQMGSYEGITRGASKEKIYSDLRLSMMAPSRLFTDAQTNQQWRLRGFTPVLNERQPDPATNREASVMAKLLQLKKRHDFPKAGLLPAGRFDFSLYRDQACPALEEMADYAKDHPEWGMPYGLPPLTDKEQQTLMRWLEAGAPVEAPTALAKNQLDEVQQWEVFLNGDSLKAQLMARYIYEHWFLAHLYFTDLPETAFFELVRSTTPPGQAIGLIASRRPFDDPQVARVYYRLRPLQGTVLSKTHLPYALNAARMQRLKGWFLDAPYTVTALPSYTPEIAANPFVAFAQLPVRSRYRLMLDEAQFTVMGFIKGPVCRGQVAINVINDYFWIGFAHPDNPDQNSQQLLTAALQQTDLPISDQSLGSVLKWRTYAAQENQYLQAKSTLMNKALSGQHAPNLSLLWDGDGTNANAALTVFRNFDNASIVQGFVGEQPQTAMIIGYPLLERIHYLLVAGFDVFGTVAHQLQARLYMDFLRMEGEQNALAFLPLSMRGAVQDKWYRNAPDAVLAHLHDKQRLYVQNTGILYKTQEPWPEFTRLWKRHLSPVLDTRYELTDPTLPLDLLKQLAGLKGKAVSYLPETVFITLSDAQHPTQHFTLIRNSAHSNVSELFKEEDRRLPDEDTLTLVPGFLGAYPNAFYRLGVHQLPDLINTIQHLNSEDSYTDLSARFAIRRTNPQFWPHTDLLHAAYRKSFPIEAGLFDFNRFENR
ncbi:fatty acid cis/trans isomerase [Methylovulum psychrotolerans]|uniref:fatty acid cis/trans isomerase n=1 Tax=Methylovulum psychrotolerans TaxID=1704499 RepID=UPI001BFF9133|nr:fatty acid cis/trans isomerase [Methylovulum psychrotolerans]MBT9100176.1 fatty acid cis/trans isomerase [Methylovulum psychrotolerans]